MYLPGRGIHISTTFPISLIWAHKMLTFKTTLNINIFNLPYGYIEWLWTGRLAEAINDDLPTHITHSKTHKHIVGPLKG